MRQRLVLSAIVVMALVLAACAADNPTTDPGAASQPEGTTTTTTTVPDSTQDSPQADDPNATSLEDYLVAMINTEADLEGCAEQADKDSNAALDEFPDDFVPTPEDELEFMQGYWEAQAECRVETDDALAALAPPPEAGQAHDDLISARRAYNEGVRTAVADAQTPDEVSDALFDPPPDVLALYVVWVDACRELEDVAAAAGIDAGLGCPLPPPGDVVEALLIVDASGWSVEPSPVVEDAGAGVVITIENRTDEILELVIVDIFSGRSDDLPTVGGVLDRSRCNESFDNQVVGEVSSPAEFGCPELAGEGEPIPVHEVHPGELHLLEPIGVGTHVILDFRAGAYEAGNYAVVEVVEAG